MLSSLFNLAFSVKFKPKFSINLYLILSFLSISLAFKPVAFFSILSLPSKPLLKSGIKGGPIKLGPTCLNPSPSNIPINWFPIFSKSPITLLLAISSILGIFNSFAQVKHSPSVIGLPFTSLLTKITANLFLHLLQRIHNLLHNSTDYFIN